MSTCSPGSVLAQALNEMSTLATRCAGNAAVEPAAHPSRRCHRWQPKPLATPDTFHGAQGGWPRSTQQDEALQNPVRPDLPTQFCCNGEAHPGSGSKLQVLVVLPSLNVLFTADFTFETSQAQSRVGGLRPDMTPTHLSVPPDAALPECRQRNPGQSVGALVARPSRRVSSPAPGQVLTSTCRLALGDPLP